MRSPRWTMAVLAALVLVAPAHALRVMTYNILNYSSGRSSELRAVIAGSDPDVIVVEEILSQGAVDNFLMDVLDVTHPGEFVAGDFLNGNDSDNAIFYKDAVVTYHGHFRIITTLRDIDEWTVRPVGYSNPASNLRLYVVHLKASQGGTNEQRRLDEVTSMRTRMETFPAGQNYLVTGDFNIYNSGEPAYVYMLNAANGTAGVVVDPISSPGNWHNSAAFASIHTQSPRVTQFGGGANGGMDDRFDMILTSPGLNDGQGLAILSSTYTAYGQDGLHFNDAINALPVNQAVGQEMADNLHDASDHIPVFANFQLPAILLADTALDFGTVIVGATAEATLQVENGATAPADELDYIMTPTAGFTAPLGGFEAEAEAGPNDHIIGMNTGSAANRTGVLDIASDAPDDPSAGVALMGIVLDHAAPSTDPNSVFITGTVDFGTHQVGSFLDQTAFVYNQGYDALQALLDVYAGGLTGDPRFTIVDGFDPASVGADPGEWEVHFDDTGAGDGPYTATFTLNTRDQQDLAGAVNLADITYAVIANVGTEVGVDDFALIPSVTGLSRLAPNPFRPATTISFAVARDGHVVISIYDVGGRQVRQLTSELWTAGRHDVRWDGRSDRGLDVGAGMFYVQLTAPGVSEMKRLVRLR